jgi:hypothetical protein
MKIHIYYRHYDTTKVAQYRPEWFSYEKCYDNLLTTLPEWNSNLYNVNVIYDGTDDSWITKYSFHKFYRIQAGSDFNSFQQTCKIVREDDDVKEGDLIYFVENDYMHLPGWLEKVFELFNSYQEMGYVSLYDHKDKYFLPQYQGLLSAIFITDTHHWRTTPSTCGTFIVSEELFKQDYDILSTMEGDHNKWLWLSANRGRSVITAIPGLATHCMEGLLSPTINWEQI